MAGLEVADEVHAGAQRPAADVEHVVARLEPLLDEVIELKLAQVVPKRVGPAHRPAVPVGIPQAAVALGKRAPHSSLDADRDVPLELAEDRAPVSHARLPTP